jgi:hypothetical protein
MLKLPYFMNYSIFVPEIVGFFKKKKKAVLYHRTDGLRME